MEKKNRKGIEYDNDIIIFEGEYLNGKRWNGKGKEYDGSGSLIFEGEIKNGLKNGKGTQYRNGEKIFEGEYLKGIKWNGYGKEYSSKGTILYEGIYLKGKTKQDSPNLKVNKNKNENCMIY